MEIGDVRRAAAAGVVRETPVLSSRTLSERAGVHVVLKAENLQRTGLFKLRGALAKLATLGDRGGAGAVTGSAGNHAQAVAYAARVTGIPCEMFMPKGARLSKLEAASALGALTIADGIAVKRPGEGVTLALIDRWVDRLEVVGEDEVGEAMVFLMERAKLVVEGAGAVGVAAVLARRPPLTGRGTTVVVLSGGNVDAGLQADVVRRHESQAGRRLVLLARLPDRRGALALLLGLVADRGANLLDVQHLREGLDLHVRETAVALVLETRGAAHVANVVRAVREAGYDEPRLVR